MNARLKIGTILRRRGCPIHPGRGVASADDGNLLVNGDIFPTRALAGVGHATSNHFVAGRPPEPISASVVTHAWATHASPIDDTRQFQLAAKQESFRPSAPPR